jgi:hypothetical protein
MLLITLYSPLTAFAFFCWKTIWKRNMSYKTSYTLPPSC